MFFFSLLSSLQEEFSGARLFYWAASRHRLFLYWPISRSVFGRGGVSPDLPLPGWEATGAGEGLADGWEISVQVVVSGKVLEQETGSEGRGCCMAKESRPAGHQRRCGRCTE